MTLTALSKELAAPLKALRAVIIENRKLVKFEIVGPSWAFDPEACDAVRRLWQRHLRLEKSLGIKPRTKRERKKPTRGARR